MIAATLKTKNNREIKPLKTGDIITAKFVEKTVYNEDGSKTIKRIPERVNITKKVNESKKLIKSYTAEEKLQEIERLTRR